MFSLLSATLVLSLSLSLSLPQSAPTPTPDQAPAPRAAQAKESGRGWLGVVFSDDGDSGAPVQSVAEGSPAANAGLRSGDRLLSMDGKPCDDFDSVVALLRERAPGTQATLRIRREVALHLDDDHKTEDGRYALGVSLPSQDRSGAQALDVGSVSAGYPAARAGLKAHDRLVAIDGKLLEGYPDLVGRMKSVKEPVRLRVQFERDLSVTLGSVPAETAMPAQPRTTPSPQGQPRATPPSPQGQPEPRWQLIPPGSYAQPSADLERELRALSEQLRELREELAQLRAELQALRDQR